MAIDPTASVHPSAIVADANGALYITVFGEGEKGGKLLKVELDD